MSLKGTSDLKLSGSFRPFSGASTTVPPRAHSVPLRLGPKAPKPIPADAGLNASVGNFFNPSTISAICLFALTVIVYRKTLDAFHLSVAYPIMVSGGLVLVTGAAWALPRLREKITALQIRRAPGRTPVT